MYWNKCNIIPNKIYAASVFIREILDTSCEGVKRLFDLAYGRDNEDATENSHRKYFLPRLTIKNYNIEINGRNFDDQPTNDSIKQYEEARKISTGQGDD